MVAHLKTCSSQENIHESLGGGTQVGLVRYLKGKRKFCFKGGDSLRNAKTSDRKYGALTLNPWKTTKLRKILTVQI